MTQARVSPAARDQLINQIIHQGKAKRRTLATDTYSSSLSVKGYKLRPVPGSRDKTTQPIPRGGRSGSVRPSKALDAGSVAETVREVETTAAARQRGVVSCTPLCVQ